MPLPVVVAVSINGTEGETREYTSAADNRSEAAVVVGAGSRAVVVVGVGSRAVVVVGADVAASVAIVVEVFAGAGVASVPEPLPHPCRTMAISTPAPHWIHKEGK